MKTKSNYLQKYYQVCTRLAQEFSDQYLDGQEGYWVDETGGVWGIGDYFLSMEWIAKVMKTQPTFERFDEAYWYCTDTKNPPKLNFENYLKYGNFIEKK